MERFAETSAVHRKITVSFIFPKLSDTHSRRCILYASGSVCVLSLSLTAPMAKQSPNYHLSDLEKSVEWPNCNLVTVLSLNCHLTNFYPNLMNGNLATILLPNYHLAVHTRTQTQMEPEVFQKHNIFTARNEVAARYSFYTYVSFCSRGGVSLSQHTPQVT